MRHKLITTLLACAVAAFAAACSTTNPPAPAPTTAAPPSPSLKAIKLVAPTSVAGLPAFRPQGTSDLTVLAFELRESLQSAIPASGQYIQDTYSADRKTVSLAVVAASGVTLEQIKKAASNATMRVDGTAREVTFEKQGAADLGCAPAVNAKILCAWFDAQSAGLVIFLATTTDAKGETIKVYTQAVQR